MMKTETKTYLRHNGYVVELTTLARTNGTVESPEYGTLYLVQQAYMSDSDRSIYIASAIDAHGNEYAIRWDTTDAWEEAYAETKDEQERTGDYSRVSSYLEDESNACDWDNPSSVELYSEGEYYLIPDIHSSSAENDVHVSVQEMDDVNGEERTVYVLSGALSDIQAIEREIKGRYERFGGDQRMFVEVDE